jgi:hypothetical protein
MLSFPLALAASQLLLLNSSTKPALAAGKSTATRTAADFLPASSTPGFVTYSPDERATPSIRAGVINPAYYSFDLPSNWNEGTILNIQSGNFCMPNCPEPWTETIWKSPADGQCTLIVSQLSRLISKSNATLKDLGTPESVVERIGNFITGNYLDTEDVTNIQVKDGYYVYEVFAPYAKDGAHSIAAFTVKKDLAYLFVVAANEKQWAKSEEKLRHMVDSFKP